MQVLFADVNCLPTAKFLKYTESPILSIYLQHAHIFPPTLVRNMTSHFLFSCPCKLSVLIIHNCVTLNTANGLTQKKWERMACQHRHKTLSEQFNSYGEQHCRFGGLVFCLTNYYSCHIYKDIYIYTRFAFNCLLILLFLTVFLFVFSLSLLIYSFLF